MTDSDLATRYANKIMKAIDNVRLSIREGQDKDLSESCGLIFNCIVLCKRKSGSRLYFFSDPNMQVLLDADRAKVKLDIVNTLLENMESVKEVRKTLRYKDVRKVIKEYGIGRLYWGFGSSVIFDFDYDVYNMCSGYKILTSHDIRDAAKEIIERGKDTWEVATILKRFIENCCKSLNYFFVKNLFENIKVTKTDDGYEITGKNLGYNIDRIECFFGDGVVKVKNKQELETIIELLG